MDFKRHFAMAALCIGLGGPLIGTTLLNDEGPRQWLSLAAGTALMAGGVVSGRRGFLEKSVSAASHETAPKPKA